MTLRSVSPAYIAAKERAREVRAAAEDDRRRQEIAEDTFAQACAKEFIYRYRRRRFSWNLMDWIAPC